MAKKILELKQFMSGIVSSASDADIPEESPVFAANVDAINEEGKITPINKDLIEGAGDYLCGVRVFPDTATFKGLSARPLSHGYKWKIYIDNDLKLTTSPSEPDYGIYNSLSTLKTALDAVTNFQDIALIQNPFVESEGTLYQIASLTSGINNTQLNVPTTWTPDGLAQFPYTGEITLQQTSTPANQETVPVNGYDSTNNAITLFNRGETPLAFSASDKIMAYIDYSHFIISFEGQGTQDVRVELYTSNDVLVDTFTSQDLSSGLDINPKNSILVTSEANDGADTHTDVVYYDKNVEEEEYKLSVLENFYSENGTNRSNLDNDWYVGNANEKVSLTKGGNSVYVGMGNQAESITKWFGKIEHKQFGNTFEGYHLEDARLKPTDEDHSVQSMQYIHNPVASTNTTGTECHRVKDHILGATNHDNELYYIKTWLSDAQDNSKRGKQIGTGELGFTPLALESSLHITKILSDPNGTYTAWAPTGWSVESSEPTTYDTQIYEHYQNDTMASGSDDYVQQFYCWTTDKNSTNRIRLYAFRYIDDRSDNQKFFGIELANFRLVHEITVNNIEMNTNLENGAKIERKPPGGATISDIYEKDDKLYIQYYRPSGFSATEEWLYVVDLNSLDSSSSQIMGIDVSAKPITPSFLELTKFSKDYDNKGFDWWANAGVFDGALISNRKKVGVSVTYNEYSNRFKWRNCDMLGFAADGYHVEQNVKVDGLAKNPNDENFHTFYADHGRNHTSRLWGWNSDISSLGYDGGEDASVSQHYGYLVGETWGLTNSKLDIESVPSETIHLGKSYGFKKDSYRVFPHEKGLMNYRESSDDIGVACFLKGEQLTSKTEGRYSERKTWKLFGDKKIENVIYNNINPTFKDWNDWVILPATRHSFGTLQRTFADEAKVLRSRMDSDSSTPPYTHIEKLENVDAKNYSGYFGSTWSGQGLNGGPSSDETSEVVSGTTRIIRMKNGFRAGSRYNLNEGTGSREASEDYKKTGHNTIIPFEVGPDISSQPLVNIANIMPSNFTAVKSFSKGYAYTDLRTESLENSNHVIKTLDRIYASISSPDVPNSATCINKYNTKDGSGNFIDNLSSKSVSSPFTSNSTFGPFQINNIGQSRITASAHKIGGNVHIDHQLYPTTGKIKSGFARTENDVGEESTGTSDFANPDSSYLFLNAGSSLSFEMDFDFQKNTGTNDEGENNPGRFNDGVTYYYKFSFLHDGFQEGPLTQVPYEATPDEGTNFNACRVRISITNAPKRASHIVIYRKNDEAEFYRMVKEIPLDDQWAITQGTNNYYKYFEDEGFLGATYEAVTGMPEDLQDTNMHYNLSEIAMGHLVVADCYHEEVNNAKTFIFKSQPGAYSNFDWSKDYCVLPSRPTAIKWYAGKLYAFDLYNMWRINLDTMTIEDAFEGIGCIGPESILVTDFGMFFADYQGIYYHNGTRAENISRDISKNSAAQDWAVDTNDITTNKQFQWSPWQEITHDINPHAVFSPEDQCVLFCFKNKHTASNGTVSYRYGAWKFSITRKRWDFVEIEDFMSTLTGNRNDTYLGGVEKLVRIGGNSNSKKSIEWVSKNFNMGSLSEDKVLISIKVQFNNQEQAQSFYESSKDSFTIYSDNNEVSSSNIKAYYETNSLQVRYKINGSNKKFKKMRFSVKDLKHEIDSISIIYRNKNVKS